MQCFKVFWTVLYASYEDFVDVDEDINEPIARMLKEGWRIVNVQSNISNPGGRGDSPCLAVSVLFENDK